MELKDIKKIAVLGAGTMGPGIAQSYASGGYEVSVYTRRQETLDKAKVMLETNLGTFVEEGELTQAQADDIKSRISFHRSVEETVEGAQFVQETVAEKPDIKTEIFKQLDELLPEDAVIVSNASSLNPFLYVPERRLPNFTTAHWFAPPHILPLVEVAKGEKTSEETMQLAIDLLEKCGKTPVRLEKFVPGYIINRIQILLNTEIFYLLDNGICTPEQLDLAVKASLMPRGMVLGLVQRYDFTGLDISANNIINASYVMPETSKRPKVLFDHVDKGELGVKTGKGFYDYSGRSAAELSKERDKKLMEVLRTTRHLIKEKI
ncbi:MAG TPA: 3-hydroxyacyl-CoA dehydrogenase family protein [Clostridiales bacterium]|nr:3-hydroxyacyl-CoA dehydrogenase family protein [Clostridiales bacterium]